MFGSFTCGIFQSRIHQVVAGLLATQLLYSCALLPRTEFKMPEVAVAANWQAPAVTGSAIANQENWWKGFNDPVLDGLISRALTSNNDLAAATIKVRRARLQSGLTDTNLTPSVTVSASGAAQRDLHHGTTSQSYALSGALSYELDLWGKLAGTRDAARWEAEATEVDRQNTALSLIGTTASAYWKVAFLNQRVATTEASIAYAQRTLDLVQVKYGAGAVSGIELAQAQRSLATQKAILTQLLQQRTETRHGLAILFDQAPQNSVAERQRLPDGPIPAIDAGLPASLLSRRPDLRAAELRLREQLVNVDVTRASFYPAFTLTGSLGTSSTSLASALQNPVATLGAGLVLPFVQWNTAKLSVSISRTQYEEAVVNFRQTLYQALSDVENALSAHEQYQAESVYLEQALSSARQAERLAEVRCRAGATGVQAWLDEQERRRNAETSLAENRLNLLGASMKLYQALGGDMQIVAAGAQRSAQIQ